MVAVMYAIELSGVHDGRLLLGHGRWRSGRGDGSRGPSCDEREGRRRERQGSSRTIIESRVARPRRVLYDVQFVIVLAPWFKLLSLFFCIRMITSN